MELPFEVAEGNFWIQVTLLGTVVVSVGLARLLLRRIACTGLLGHPGAWTDRRVRFWVRLPAWLGSAALVTGLVGFAVVSSLGISWTFSTGGFSRAQFLEIVGRAAALLLLGGATATIGLIAAWRGEERVRAWEPRR